MGSERVDKVFEIGNESDAGLVEIRGAEILVGEGADEELLKTETITERRNSKEGSTIVSLTESNKNGVRVGCSSEGRSSTESMNSAKRSRRKFFIITFTYTKPFSDFNNFKE